jgi:TctA family transporter
MVLLQRPFSAVFLILSVISVAVPVIKSILAQKKAAS